MYVPRHVCTKEHLYQNARVRSRTSKRSEPAAAALLGASALRSSSPGSSTMEWHALAANAAVAATGASRVSSASSSPAGPNKVNKQV